MPNFPVDRQPVNPVTPIITKPAETKTDSAAVVTPQPVITGPVDLGPVDGSTAKGAVDTPIDPVVDDRAKFPPTTATAKPADVEVVQSLSEPDTVAPASLPPKLKESYNTLSKRLNADPKVNYIAIDNQAQNKGLSQFLAQFKDQLDNTPGLKEKLAQTPAGQALLEALEHASQGGLSSEDILKLQTFIVSSGEDISHPNSASGIDGVFGNRTHQGLQNAFDKLLTKPDETIQGFEANYATASQKAEAQRADYANMGGDVPNGGYADPVSPGSGTTSPSGTGPATDAGPAAGPPPPAGATTDLGRDIAASVNRTRGPMAARLAQLRRERGMSPSADGPYRCYEGVKKVLNGLNPPINLTGGSAYMAADQLRAQSDRFKEVKLTCPPDAATRRYLQSLPAGAIVVWGPSNNPAKRAQGEKDGNGFGNGHISVALGNGREFSDRDRAQIVSTRDPERYGSVSVFIPN